MNNNITKLMRYLLLVGVIIFLALVIFPLIAGRQGALSSLEVQEKQTNLTVSRALAHAYWPELEHLLVDTDASNVDTSGLEQALEELLEGFIVKVNLFNREGVSVYSTNAGVMGEKETDNENFVAALKGEISQEFERYTLTENSEEIRVLAVYLPICYHIDPDLTHDTEDHHAADHHDSNEVIGVLELYSNVTPQIQGINRVQVGIALSTTVLLLLIYGSAFFFLRRATKTVADKQQQLERYGLLVEHTPSMLMEATGDGQLVFMNPSAKKHFPELAAFESASVLPATRHPLFAAWENVTAHLQPGMTFEREVMVGNGVYSQKVSYNAGSQNYDIYAYDLTQLKRSETELLKAQRDQRALLGAVPDMVFVMSKDGTYLDVKLDKTHGLIEELVGRNVRELGFMSREIAEGIAKKLQTASSSGETQSLEYSLEGNINNVRRLAHYEARFAPIDKDKVLMLVRDVSQRHDDEMALQTLTKEAQRHARELLLLDKVRSVATQELELKGIITKTVDTIAETFDYTLASIYLLEGDELVMQYQVGYAQFIERLPITKGVMGKVARTGQALLLKDSQDDPEFLAAFEGINSEICVPLFDAGKVVGVLNLESTEKRFFDEADFRLMNALAETLGVAIERARLYQETRANEQTYRDLYTLSEQQSHTLSRRNDELLLLECVRDAIANELELVGLYQAVADRLARNFGYYAVRIFEVTDTMFRPVCQLGAAVFARDIPPENGVAGRVLRNNRAVLVSDVLRDPDYVGFESEMLSEISVPLHRRGDVVGILSVETRRKDNIVLTEDDLRLISVVAEQVDVAIERAYLYQETKANESKFRELYLVTQEQAQQLAQLYQELQRKEERYRELIENASDIIYRSDLKGRFVYANSVVKRILGYEEQEVIGKQYLSLVRPDYHSEVQAFYFQQLRDTIPTTYLEFPAVSANGQEVWIGQNVSLVRDGEKIVGMQAVARDITERKQMEEALLTQAEELSSANADLEQFAFIAAHDLQEPLRKIQAFGDRLNLKYKNVLDDTGRDYLERMRLSATRMRTLIDDLLSFARANKQQKREIASLEPIVKGVLSDLQVRIEETEATVSVGSLPTLELDPSQFRQVFQNLLSNALKFRKSDIAPVITVYSHRLGTGDWEIRVSDNGIGFEEQYKERVFGVFQRLHSREQYEGTGIGLAIVRRIIEGHDGKIEVSSRPGEGTTFFVTLPGVAKIHTEDPENSVVA